jgi:hypothetical protein
MALQQRQPSVKILLDVTFEVLTAVKMWIVVSWVVASCGLVDGYQPLGETSCLHL